MLDELLKNIGYDKDKLFVEDKARDVKCQLKDNLN
jgi:hypothetical protein